MKQAAIVLFFLLAAKIDASDHYPSDQPIEVNAFRAMEAIQIDGHLDEPVWQNGYCVWEFRQRDPIEGANPTEKTEVRVAYDDQALYIGARMYDSKPDSINARLERRDAFSTTDMFGFFIDPYFDRRSGYFFALSAGGTLHDGLLMNDEWDDDSWDAVWQGKTSIDQLGWIAEMRIPFSQLRFKKQKTYVWGVNFRRDIARKNEVVYLVFTPKSGSGFVSRFPKMTGLENIDPPNNIEILPYLRAKGEFSHPAQGDPFNDGSRYLPGLGLDMKYGLSSNLTLNTTINPDFGQVEVDPAVVNLSDVETFFEEKRPFFMEGSSIFSFGSGGSRSNWGFNWENPSFFYSRRIGRTPQGTLPDHDYRSVPEGTRILGAAKLSGKIGDNWNLGAIHALTGREFADLKFLDKKSKIEIEPLSHYSVLRIQKEIDSGFHGIGMMATSAIRDFDDVRLKDEINSRAFSIGLDGWTFLDKEKAWVISSWAGWSQVQGTKKRILALQQDAGHYFQRPDAKAFSLDSSANRLQGYAGRMIVNKQKGNIIFNSALGIIDPGFDVRDVGFMWRTNLINYHLGGGYKWTKPGKISRYTELIGAVFGTNDFDGNTTWAGLFGTIYSQLLNYYSVNADFAYNPQTVNIYRTRGGPITINKPGFQFDFSVESDERKSWIFEVDYFTYFYSTGAYQNEIGLELEWKPLSNVSLSIEPEIGWIKDFSQWIGGFTDESATRTYGKRYVFASLDYTELSSSLRLNWTFTPDLSFQLYVQPLIAAADYYDYKYLTKSRSYDFTVFGQGNSTIQMVADTLFADADGPGSAPGLRWNQPDFNRKSLRGNAVLRWEYQAGSTLYLVWTQTRYHRDNLGDFQFNRSIDRLFDSQADNIFMIKLTYWLNL